MSNKEVIPKMNKDLLKLNNKSSGYPIKKWTNDLETPHQKRCTDDKKSHRNANINFSLENFKIKQ